MIRSTKHTLKFTTKSKREQINHLFLIYALYLQKTIDMFWNKEIPLKKFMNTKDVFWMNNLGGQYKQLIYKQASEIVRGCLKRKGKKSKPVVKNFTINFDEKFIKSELSHNSFDKWIRLRLPFVKKGYKNHRIEILIPIKGHKHSLKFKDWKQVKTIKLSKTYISFIFEKEAESIKQEGKSIGLDCGYKKLLVSSEGQIIGKELEGIYTKISRKEQGSKAFKRALIERDNKINEVINKEVDLTNVKQIVVEDLKSVKSNSKGKIRKHFNNKLQRWSYPKVINKLERFCEENRVLLTKEEPAYTSQLCSVCGAVDKANRKGELYQCSSCGNVMDADYNASINILHRGAYSPSIQSEVNV